MTIEGRFFSQLCHSMISLIIFSVPQFALAESYLVVGTGAPRSDRHSCNKDIVAFEASLKSNHLVPVEKTVCTKLADNTDQFEPRFKVKSDQTLSIETISGARFASKIYCEVERDRMITNTPKSTPVIDSTCRQVSAPSFKNANDIIYQPVVVLIKPLNAGEEATPYTAVGLLLKATEDSRINALFPPDKK